MILDPTNSLFSKIHACTNKYDENRILISKIINKINFDP